MQQLTRRASVVYHLYPGVVITACFVALTPHVVARGYPPQFSMLLCIVGVAIPLLLVHLRAARQKEGWTKHRSAERIHRAPSHVPPAELLARPGRRRVRGLGHAAARGSAHRSEPAELAARLVHRAGLLRLRSRGRHDDAGRQRRAERHPCARGGGDLLQGLSAASHGSHRCGDWRNFTFGCTRSISSSMCPLATKISK
jgi:hypothetical protein